MKDHYAFLVRCRVIVALLLIASNGCMKMNTEFSTSELPEKFEKVNVGDSVEKLYSVLGNPYHVDINPDRSSKLFQREPSDKVDLMSVREMALNTNKEIYLTYSRPKRGDVFYLYWITVAEGKVVSKHGTVPMD